MDFAQWLDDQIHSRELSIREAARASDVAHVTLLRLLPKKGRRGRRPQLDTLFRIAQWANTEPAFLMRLLGYDVANPPWPNEREIALLVKGDPRFAKLFELARGLKPGQLQQALDFIEFLLR